ncbi:hypothetical protein KSF78_0000238 [Schistosoma japonicum]|nr:hypothetical protein KSF78_0000238 [Schistosoma japonicum]
MNDLLRGRGGDLGAGRPPLDRCVVACPACTETFVKWSERTDEELLVSLILYLITVAATTTGAAADAAAATTTHAASPASSPSAAASPVASKSGHNAPQYQRKYQRPPVDKKKSVHA